MDRLVGLVYIWAGALVGATATMVSEVLVTQRLTGRFPFPTETFGGAALLILLLGGFAVLSALLGYAGLKLLIWGPK